jgi:hypothetical protein
MARRKAIRQVALDPDEGTPRGGLTVSRLERERGTVASADVRSKVWLRYLRGVSYTAIGVELDLNRGTVARIVRACYQQVRHERQGTLADALEESIARIRHMQQQAWENHDQEEEATQRATHLRLALDCEKEIARLRGLYGAVVPEVDATVVFRIELVEPSTPAPAPAALTVLAAPEPEPEQRVALPAPTAETERIRGDDHDHDDWPYWPGRANRDRD